MNKPLIIVTGASSGIGAAIAKLFAQAGYPLGLLARNVEAMERLALPQSLCLAVDVTDSVALQKAVKTLEDKFGPVDGMVNNAGYGKGGEFLETEQADHETMIKVNVLGVVNGLEAVLPGMRERQRGTIINISSVADRSARPQLATYAATKAAVKSLSDSLRVANAKYGIRICNIAPAKVLTPMLIAAKLNSGQTITAEDLAKTVLWMYEQPQSICIRDLVIAPTTYET